MRNRLRRRCKFRGSSKCGGNRNTKRSLQLNLIQRHIGYHWVKALEEFLEYWKLTGHQASDINDFWRKWVQGSTEWYPGRRYAWILCSACYPKGGHKNSGDLNLYSWVNSSQKWEWRIALNQNAKKWWIEWCNANWGEVGKNDEKDDEKHHNKYSSWIWGRAHESPSGAGQFLWNLMRTADRILVTQVQIVLSSWVCYWLNQKRNDK